MIDVLSNRENDVVAEITKGYTVKEVANKLFISPYTVDSHIKNAKKKTGARTLPGLTRIFVLALDNPKEFYKKSIVLFFIGIQLFITLVCADFDLRRPRSSRSRTKVHRTARKYT